MTNVSENDISTDEPEGKEESSEENNKEIY